MTTWTSTRRDWPRSRPNDRLAARLALATTYTLSALPATSVHASLFQVTVEHRGRDRWAVLRHRCCLSADGEWDYESRPSTREEEWLASHRFDLDTALRLAEEALPMLTVSGMTTADVLARDTQRPTVAERLRWRDTRQQDAIRDTLFNTMMSAWPNYSQTGEGCAAPGAGRSPCASRMSRAADGSLRPARC